MDRHSAERGERPRQRGARHEQQDASQHDGAKQAVEPAFLSPEETAQRQRGQQGAKAQQNRQADRQENQQITGQLQAAQDVYKRQVSNRL